MNDYRMTVRFRMDNEKQRRAAEFLQGLERSRFKSRKQVIIDALNVYIDSLNAESHDDAFLERIRLMFREEVSAVAITAPTVSPKHFEKPEMTNEQKEKNARGVLNFLDNFE